MVNKYKASIIGVGRIGYTLQKDKKREQPASHASAISGNRRLDLAAACDLNEERLRLFQKDYPHARVYKNHEELLAVEKPDIVVIAVNEENHLKVSIDTVRSGPRLVILEKPVAPDVDSAKMILKESVKQHVPVMINHERRFSGDYILVKKILRQRKLGEIHGVHAALWTGSKVWTKDSSKTGSCLLIHDGTHLIDIIHFLFDFDLKNPVIDNMVRDRKNNVISLFVHYNSADGRILYMDFSGNRKYFGFEIEIEGSLGRIIIGNGYLKAYFTRPSGLYSNFMSLSRDKSIKRPRKTGYFSGMISNAVNFLDGKAKLLSPIEDGVKVLKDIYTIAGRIS